MSDRVKSELAVTLELTGTTMTDIGVDAVLAELEAHPVDDVVVALRRCRRESRYKLTLADILERLPGTLGAEAAWALALKHRVWAEDATIVVPAAVLMAFPFGIWAAGDKVGARMAFKEQWVTEVAKPDAMKMTVTLGQDAIARTAPFGRLSVMAA